MIELALAGLTATIAVAIAVCAHLARTIRAMQRDHDRRVDMLLDRLAAREGNPWTEAPAVTTRREPLEPRIEYTRSPEQIPGL